MHELFAINLDACAYQRITNITDCDTALLEDIDIEVVLVAWKAGQVE